MLTRPHPVALETSGLSLVRACVELYRHGFSVEQIKEALKDRCAGGSLRSALSQARLALGWRTVAERPPLVRTPLDPVPPVQRLSQPDRTYLRKAVAHMTPEQRADYGRLVKEGWVALDAAAKAAPVSRPRCSSPESCAAKGPGHCRPCAGRSAMAALRSDPVFVQRLTEVARSIGPEARAASAANLTRLNKDPVFAAKRDANGRRMVAAFSADPAIVKTRTMKAVISKAERLARRLNIPVHLVDDLRELRGQGLTEARAVIALKRAHVETFRAIQEAEVAKYRRIIDRRMVGPVSLGDPSFERSALGQRLAAQAAAASRIGGA